MPLFVVQHKHPADACPAGHPEMGPMLLKHVSSQNATTFGVRVLSEAVVDGSHTFYLTVEADNDKMVNGFMGPFYQVGTVEIWPANSCEQVVSRARC